MYSDNNVAIFCLSDNICQNVSNTLHGAWNPDLKSHSSCTSKLRDAGIFLTSGIFEVWHSKQFNY